MYVYSTDLYIYSNYNYSHTYRQFNFYKFILKCTMSFDNDKCVNIDRQLFHSYMCHVYKL